MSKGRDENNDNTMTTECVRQTKLVVVPVRLHESNSRSAMLLLARAKFLLLYKFGEFVVR